MKTMTPLEITDYKKGWLPGTVVFLHSDVYSRALTWCKTNVPKHQYHFKLWVDVYQHSVFFESNDIANKLIKESGLESFLSR